jgi:hypothetical protein
MDSTPFRPLPSRSTSVARTAPSMMTALPLGSRSNRPFVAGSCLDTRNPLELVGHMLPGMRGELD